MSKWRKKPVDVEVHRWTLNDNDDGDSFGNDHMAEWLGKYYESIDGHWLSFSGATGQHLTALVGDYIACQPAPGGNLDFWPIAPDMFHATYEPAESVVS